MNCFRYLILLIGCLIPTSLFANDWSNTYLGYHYSTDYTEPGVEGHLSKKIMAFEHVRGNDAGSTFFHLDVLQSDSSDPATGADNRGATEAYLVLRHQFYLSNWFSESQSIQNWALTIGADLNTKNSYLAPRTQLAVVGPTYTLGWDDGFLDMSLLAAYEKNHNAYIVDPAYQEHSFDPFWIINVAFARSFTWLEQPFQWSGFLNYQTKKGKPAPLEPETRYEFLLQTKLMWGVGHLMSGLKDKLWLGLGYQHWNNKFGLDGRFIDGTMTRAPYIAIEWHF